MNYSEYKNIIWNSVMELRKYYDMGFILNNLDSAIVLPTPYRNYNSSKKTYNENRAISEETESTAQKTFSMFEKELMLRKEIFEYIRQSNPDFAKYLPDEDFKEYRKLWDNCKKNINVLVNRFKTRDNDYKKLLLSNQDIVSFIIDSTDTAKLTFIEDKFVLDQLEGVDLTEMEPEMICKIECLKAELEERIKKYYEFDELTNKKQIAIRSRCFSTHDNKEPDVVEI